MTKPWEEMWYLGDKERWQVADGHFIRTSADKSGACMVLAGKSVAEFVAAAPDMARALLAVLPHEDEAGPKPPAHIRECLEWRQRHGLITECATGCQEVMAALRKAGVIS